MTAGATHLAGAGLNPDYLDCLHYAYFVGMRSPVPDVQVKRSGTRGLIALHGVLLLA